MDDAVEKWRSRWENSILEVFIFQSIAARPRYGGELIELAQTTISSDIKIPTVYAILKRSKGLGLLEDFTLQEKDDITRGKKRRYYRMNETGMRYFNNIVAAIEENQEFLATLHQIEIFEEEVP